MQVHDDVRQARDAQHRISVLQAQVQEVEVLRSQLAQEQKAASDWREMCGVQVRGAACV